MTTPDQMSLEEVERRLWWFREHIKSGGSLSNKDAAALLGYCDRLIALARPAEPPAGTGDDRTIVAESIGAAMVHMSVMNGGRAPDDWCWQLADAVLAALRAARSRPEPEATP